ncbi:MAG: aminoglycoside phosphotransferase [Deltaproteobacteria bacterium]|nr:aminoglycoside phosphotransferase [Deltaproteobacteria bacterium]
MPHDAPARRVAREPYHRDVRQLFRRRDRLDHRLDAGRLRGRHVRAVADALAALHDGAEVCGDEAPAAPLALAKRLRARADKLEAQPSTAGAAADLERLLTEQQRFLVDAIETLLQRAASGRVRRIHGRIGCRSVWVGAARGVRFAKAEPGARGDVAEDVAGLAIDLCARGAPRLAEAFAAAYAWAADDYALYRVMDGYARDAALRMALAAASRGKRDARGPEPATYLRAALGAVHPAPLVIAIGGAVATGKSTLARAVSRRLAAPRVEADRVRRTLLAPLPDGVAHRRLWEGDFAERVYRGMLRRAADVLAGGRPVVLDACFPDARRRAKAAELAARHGAEFVFVHCDARPEQVEARLARRASRDGGLDGGWTAIARSVTEHWQTPSPGEAGRYLRIDTGRPRREWLAALGLDAKARP